MDETVVLGVTDNGSPTAVLETTDDAVREWDESTLDEYCEEARPLAPERDANI